LGVETFSRPKSSSDVTRYAEAPLVIKLVGVAGTGPRIYNPEPWLVWQFLAPNNTIFLELALKIFEVDIS